MTGMCKAPHLFLTCLLAGVTPGQAQEPPQLSADLDHLLNFAELWTSTRADFATRYTAKTDDATAEKPPQFEWMSAEQDRARFSRKMFRNVETRLTMFGKSVKVEEAVVEFVNDRPARVSVCFYHRGDSGAMETADFERIFKTVGQSLNQALKSAPRSVLNPSAGASKLVSWGWNTPQVVALLEHNDYSPRASGGAAGQPEFLRLKLAAPSQADWTMGRLSTGVGRMGMAANVRKSADGDVHIANVPMVDQGDKGYCVAATCQRLFEYLRVPCDQHELANLVSVDAQSGVNIFSMQKSLKKVVGTYRVNFKTHINPELYYDNRRQRRVSLQEFTGIVKEHIGKGVPLLWALELGKYKEDPPLPVSGQTIGGHMRMIIGYNEAKKHIIFSDTWGAGHELKRMDLPSAWECSIGLYSMTPR